MYADSKRIWQLEIGHEKNDPKVAEIAKKYGVSGLVGEKDKYGLSSFVAWDEIRQTIWSSAGRSKRTRSGKCGGARRRYLLLGASESSRAWDDAPGASGRSSSSFHTFERHSEISK
jgi:hypothetical protein